MTRRVVIGGLVLLLALTVAAVIVAVTKNNRDFAARQQEIANCEAFFHYSQKRCETLYP